MQIKGNIFKSRTNLDEVLLDKFGTVIKHLDIMCVNPDDDDWLDMVTTYKGKLVFVSEIESYGGNVPLRDVLKDSDNPAIVVGHLLNFRLEFHKW